MPVYQLLGGRCRDGVLAYSHASGATLEEITNSAKALMDQGFRVVRCQGSDYSWTPSPPSARSDSWPPIADGIAVETFDSSRYVRGVSMMFEHLRAQLGDDVELCHDAHQRLSPPEAARLAAILEPFRPFFLEDPLRPEDAHRLRDVRSASTTPIAMGELLHSLADCVSFLKEGFVDFIRCDLAHSGGVTEARRIAAVAGASGVKTAWHGPADISPIAQAASIHLDLSTPNFGVQEFTAYPDSVREVIESGVLFKDGFLYLSEDPGLGVSVNERELTNFPYRPKLLPMARRTDGSFQDW
jgi:mannonate dehydratase